MADVNFFVFNKVLETEAAVTPLTTVAPDSKLKKKVASAMALPLMLPVPAEFGAWWLQTIELSLDLVSTPMICTGMAE